MSVDVIRDSAEEPAGAGGTASKKPPSYFWHIALLYVAFNVLLSPLQSWSDLLIGLRTANTVLIHHPFNQGNFFFYPIVLNSDSIFRIVQHSILARAAPTSSPPSLGMLSGIAACVILLTFSLLDYSGWQGMIAAGKTPALPANDQIFFTVVSLLAGYLIHHNITAYDLKARS
jgi:hypothetical protein